MSFMGINMNMGMIAQIALAAATGGASAMVTMAAQQLATQVAMNVIQQVGEQLGLPQSMIDIAQAGFAAQSGRTGLARMETGQAVQNFAGQLGLSPSEQGNVARAADDAVDNAVSQIMDNIRNDRFGVDENGGSRSRDRASTSGKSFIMMIAEILGNKLNEAAKELEEKADSTDWKDGKDMSEYNALVQQFNTLMSSVNSAIKSIGEALTTMAKRQ
jgi:hypothetical protein